MKKTLIKGTLWMTVTSFVVKVLSVVYKIPYQNITGDFGFYVYQTIYPFFSVLTSFATYSIPLVTSEFIILHGNHDIRRYRLRLVFLFWGLGLLVFLFSQPMAFLLNDPSLNRFMYLFSAVALLIPFVGILRGELYASEQTVYKVGVSNVIEQLIRVFIIGIVLFLYTHKRIKNPYIVAEYSYLGLLIGLICSLLFLLISKKGPFTSVARDGLPSQMHNTAIKRIVLLTISASVLLMMQMIDSFTITHILDNRMGIEEARQLKGIYDRSLPLIQGALFFIPPLLSIYVPYMKKYQESYGQLIEWVLLIVLPITVGLILVFPHVNGLLFKDQSGNHFLRLNLIVISLYGLILTVLALPSDHSWYDYIFIAVALTGKYSLNLYLLPKLDIVGAVYSNLISLIGLLVCLAYLRRQHLTLSVLNLTKIISSTLTMGLIVYWIGSGVLTNQWILQVIIGFLTYVGLILLFNPLNIRNGLKEIKR